MNKINSNTQTQPIPDLVITRQKNPTISNLVKVVEIKMESSKKGSAKGDMGYDIIEDIQKTKANISLFEMCNLPQQRKKLLESFDSQTNKFQYDVQLEEEIREASIGRKSKS